MKRRCSGCNEWREFTDSRRYCGDCQSNRLFSETDQEIFELLHHDFGEQWTRNEVAEELNISLTDISEALARVKAAAKKVHVTLFPILSVLEADVVELYINNYITHKAIAEHLNISKNAVAKAIARAKGKGLYVPSKRFRKEDGPKMLRYNDAWMSRFVVQQF